MIAARWACLVSAVVCFAACFVTGVWNAAWILGLLMLALAAVTSSRVQAWLAGEFVAADPDPDDLSRLDVLDGRCDCVADHSVECTPDEEVRDVA